MSETAQGIGSIDGHQAQTDAVVTADPPSIGRRRISLPPPIPHFVQKERPKRSEDDEGCSFMNHERKYYRLEGASCKYFMKRTLRLHELQYNNAGRLAPGYLAVGRARNEVAAIEFVRQNLTIPVPEVELTFFDDGAFYTILRAVDGVGMADLTEKDAQIVCRHLDRYVAELSSVRSNTIRSFVDEPCFPYRFSEALSTRFPVEYKQSPDSDYVLCHGDLARNNIIVNPDTLEVAAIIDWEYAGFYPPEMEEPFYRQWGGASQQSADMKARTDEIVKRVLQLRV